MSNKSNMIWRSLSLLMVFLLAFAPVISAPGDASAQLDEPLESKAPRFERNKDTGVDPLTKLDDTLRAMVGTRAGMELAAQAGPIAVHVYGTFNERTYPLLRQYFVDGKLYGFKPTARLGNQVLYGLIMPGSLLKAAGFPAVERIESVTIERAPNDSYPADDTVAKPEPKDLEELRANAGALRAGSLPYSQAMGMDAKGPDAPDDWWEIEYDGPSMAKVAWDEGITGEGVKVAVIDDGVDFGHPDLYGKQYIFNSGGDYPHLDGWPLMYDPFTMRAYAYQFMFGSTYISGGFEGSTYMDTSTTPPTTPCGIGLRCFDYTPLLYYNYPDPYGPYTYIYGAAWSKSGVVHVGTHSDGSLRDYVWGERVAVLVVDSHEAGVYDTVYVDLDADHDFTDEKALHKVYFTPPLGPQADMNSMIAIRDMDNDGDHDLSGGILYYIADGTHFPPAFDWLYADMIAEEGVEPPGAGDLIAMHGPHDSGYSHGTQCGSNVVGSGEIDGMMPKFSDWEPEGVVYGAAPGANLVGANNAWYFTGRANAFDAYVLAAVGWDGIDQVGNNWYMGAPMSSYEDFDAVQITSNSYGWSDDDNDGWDYLGMLIEDIMRNYAPSLQFLFSTGNGAPGYGTVAPPSPGMGIAIGSSTEYGSTGWDSITRTEQINYNDLTAFSNSGPSAREGAGPDVLAGGSYAAGAERLNYYAPSVYGTLDGNVSWSTWGGTSRSSPFAAGVLALVYDAYKQEHGYFPDSQTAKAIFMSGATDINNDVLTQGAGAVNALSALAAAGIVDGMVYMASGDEAWSPGTYRDAGPPPPLAPDGGLPPESFAHIVYPGDYDEKDFTVVNPSDSGTEVYAEVNNLELIGTDEFEYLVTTDMMAEELVYGPANQDHFYKAFNYFIPIMADPDYVGADASWDNPDIDVPEEADLMIVRAYFDYDSFDIGGDYSWDNRFYLVVYNWSDEDGDGLVWDDAGDGTQAGNNNGVVNFINGTVKTINDVDPELEWLDPRTELDRWEFGRYGYNRPTANTMELTVQDPYERMFDGMFIGLRHHPSSSHDVDVNLKFRIEYYENTDNVNWLGVGDDCNGGSAPTGELIYVPAGDSEDFTACVDIPADMPPGDYAAAIEVHQDWDWEEGKAPLSNEMEELQTIVIPVVINVAAILGDTPNGGAPQFTPNAVLGGWDTFNYPENAMRAYNNAVVRGYQDWDWRAESGDWRFFYLDAFNNVVDYDYAEYFWEPFDDGIPESWTVEVYGDPDGSWVDGIAECGYGNYTGGAGEYATADSWCMPYNVFDTWLVSPSIDLSTANNPALEFKTEFTPYTYGLSWLAYGRVWASTDGGANWDLLLEYDEYDFLFGWTETLSLAAYAGEPDVKLAFQFDSLGTELYGDGWWSIDEVLVYDELEVFSIDPMAHVIVHDVWDDAAPHTDIDTVILGPNEDHPSKDWVAGTLEMDTYDPAVHGPYNLETVAKSTNQNVGGGTWLFDTTSGANEEWLMFPIGEGGLHEVMQHNVLFEGDQVETVFTKTVGLLFEDVHEFDIDTYRDYGKLGEVRLESTIPLNGMQAEGFLTVQTAETLPDQPVDFVNSDTIEYEYYFDIVGGVELYVEVDSDNIPDIDLYLFYNDPVDGWEQRGSSTSATAHESVFIANPEDGEWMVGINNWSGPAGTFDMYIETLLDVGGIDTLVTPLDEYNYVVEVSYDVPGGLAMGPNVGLLFVGPPEAPYLKEIPIVINRRPEGVTFIEKFADAALHYPGDIAHYTLNMYNINLADSFFTEDLRFLLTDFIPDMTGYHDASLLCAEPGGCGAVNYDPVGDKVTYEGPLPSPFEPAPNDLETQIDGWTFDNDPASPTRYWYWAAYAPFAHSGVAFLYHGYNAAEVDDDWMYTPEFDVKPMDNQANFWALSDTLYPGATVTVHALGDGIDDVLWDLVSDEAWDTFDYRQITLDLSAYEGETIQLGFNYHGFDGESFVLDDIYLPGNVEPVPGATIDLAVEVDPDTAGETITNTVLLEGWHQLPQEEQKVEDSEDLAVFDVGGADLSTSKKEVDVEVVKTGDLIEYTITVENTGNGTAEVYLVDPIPAGTDYYDGADPFNDWLYNPAFGEPGHITMFGPMGFLLAGNEMYWYGHVEPGDTLVFTFRVMANGDTNLAENFAYLEWQDDSMFLYADLVTIENISYYMPMVHQE